MPAPVPARRSSKTSISPDSIELSIYFEGGRSGEQQSTRIESWLTNSSRRFRTRFVVIAPCKTLGRVYRPGEISRTSLGRHCRLKGWRKWRREALSCWSGQGHTRPFVFEYIFSTTIPTGFVAKLLHMTQPYHVTTITEPRLVGHLFPQKVLL